ncbi:MAG TPA: hypothetical protein VMU90_10070 [Solirubrobacteraceae bacterium]|nr:hypothetical protein [Solirubrobacteraceae bacterium]
MTVTTALAACGSSTSTTTTHAQTASGVNRGTQVSTRSNTAPTADSTGTLDPSRFTPTNVSVVAGETLPQIFAMGSPWNQPVDTLPVDPNSAQLLTLASQRIGAVEVPGQSGVVTQRRFVPDGVFINTTRWTDPVVTDQAGAATKVFCRQRFCGPDAVGLSSLTLPTGVNPDPRFDGWFTAINTQLDVAYDLWRARRQVDGSISFQYVKKWNLAGSGYQSPYNVSARGSGLPLFAGMITLADLRSGQINHALAISVPGPSQRNFVTPASSTDGNGSVNSLPEGARIRLKANTLLGKTPSGASRRLADAIVVALVRYGAIVVDRSAVPTLYAQKDVAARFLQGNEIQSLHLSDFQVVGLPPRIAYPNPKVTQVGPQFTPTTFGFGGGGGG